MKEQILAVQRMQDFIRHSKIVGIVVKNVVKPKNTTTEKRKNPTISDVKSLDFLVRVARVELTAS